MKIKFFNVNHGDYAIIRVNPGDKTISNKAPKLDDGTTLVVDCGAPCNKQFINKFVYKEIFSHSGKKYAMITHFHTDHTKGFKKLIKLYPEVYFDKLYIPYILVDSDKMSFLLCRHIFCVHILMHSNSSISYKITDSMMKQIELAKSLTQDPLDIIPLKAGCGFNLDNTEFKVILPLNIISVSDDILDKTKMIMGLLSKKQISILNYCVNEYVIALLIYKEKITNQEFNLHTSQKLLDNLKREKLDTEYEPGNYESIQNKLIENATYEDVLNSEGYINLAINEIRKNLKEKSNNLNKSLKSQVARTFISNKNKTSIVFHYSNKENSLKLLMTGDAACEDIRDALNNQLIKDIHLCKIPHHGTHSYFLNLPEVNIKNAVVSGKGKFSSSGGKGSVIDKQYASSPEKFNSMFCTNCNINTCEYYSMNSRKANHCSPLNYGDQYFEFNI